MPLKILMDYQMRKNNKGQIAGQVFIYVMAVIVIGVIAIIGYNAINKILAKSCDAEKATFKIDIERDIETFTSDGAIRPEKIDAPCGYDTICFIDPSQIGNNAFDCINNTIIRDSVRDGIPQNIYVMSGQDTHKLGYSELISISSENGANTKCLCIKQRNNKFYITFSGRGTSAEISEN